MNSNDKLGKSISDDMAKNDDTIIRNVTIDRMQTDYLNNNLLVRIRSPNFSGYREYLLAYPDHKISGSGIYLTLLAAIKNSFTVSLKLTGYVPPKDGYISAIMIESQGIPPDPFAPW
ncbi:hypothetical protein [Xenorhabdus sp. Sc-CR9]|uniref:hypothetical protein n=1 Tax=Xenorhabdus sp. Sc-CR9 TaxID=2584468 RepID=UPI001F4609B3|nr:hypothetical protein [Xenorhabdus sp. Sc-CR9]